MDIIFERNIWLAASEMIRRYGSDAVPRAVIRIDSLLDEDDEENITIWIQVLEAIEQLVNGEPKGALH